MKPNIETVRKLLNSGREKDLHSMMEYSSKYNIESGDNNPKNREESMIHSLATKYVWFVCKWGFDTESAREGDKFYVSHPENFEKWVSIGCVALHQEELDAYLLENPLEKC